MSAIHNKRTGFTIVELLIVIVVIAILAAISTLAYRGFTQRARESVLQHDASSGVEQIEIHRARKRSLPLANNCPSPAASEICLQGSKGTVFTYVTNHPTSPTSYQLMVSNGDISYVSSNGEPAKVAYGTRFVTLTNMVQNGDFSNGITNWSKTYCYSGNTCEVTGGVLKMISNATARINVQQGIPGPYTDGDKIFYSARVKKISGSGFSLNAVRNGGGFNKVIMSEAQFNALSPGNFTRYSDIRNYVASQGVSTSLLVNILSTLPSPAFEVEVDDVVIINLTAAFGAGNEPTAAQMDEILTQFENGYFSGTAVATY